MKKSKSFIRVFFSHTLLLINIAAVLWLLLCYMASRVHPAEIKNLTLFSLTTPFAVFTNLVFVFIWLFSSRKWFSLCSLAALIFCYQMIPAVLGYHYFPANDWSKTERSFKLMSWNVHAMGIFNPPHEKLYAQGIADLIKEESPDILCLPEFAVNADTKKSKLQEKILRENHYKAYYFNMDNGFGPKIWIGTALFSRYPVVNYKAFELSRYIYLLRCDMSLTNEKIISVCIVHLHSFGLSDHDKAYIEEVKSRNTEDLAKSRSFIWKFNQAYLLRAQEADKVAAIIKQIPYPVIICGDFNDLPFSYTYSKIKGDLNDAFTQKGRGFGRTYNQIIPTLRIDHIFYDGDVFKIKAFKTPYSDLSDHSPVIANFEY